MTDKRVWFITGAGRGMGVEFVKAALGAAASHTGGWQRPIAPAYRAASRAGFGVTAS